MTTCCPIGDLPQPPAFFHRLDFLETQIYTSMVLFNILDISVLSAKRTSKRRLQYTQYPPILTAFLINVTCFTKETFSFVYISINDLLPFLYARVTSFTL